MKKLNKKKYREKNVTFIILFFIGDLSSEHSELFTLERKHLIKILV